MTQQVIKAPKKWRGGGGGGYKKTEYVENLQFRNLTKENFDWDTEDDLDGLIETDPGIHPELAYKLPGVLLGEYTLGPVTTVETKIIDPNTIVAANPDNSVIINTTVVYNGRYTPTPIFQ